MAQCVKYLLYKHEGLDLDSPILTQKLGVMVCVCVSVTPLLGRQTGRSLSLLASQSRQIIKLPV